MPNADRELERREREGGDLQELEHAVRMHQERWTREGAAPGWSERLTPSVHADHATWVGRRDPS